MDSLLSNSIRLYKPGHSSSVLFAVVFVSLGLLASLLPAQHLQSTSRKTNGHLQSYLNAAQAPFYHGVASGDPLSDRVIVWTRVTPDDSMATSVPVTWEMATDLSFLNVIQTGSATAEAVHDFCIKIDVQNLQANTYYYYRFSALGEESAIGRTKTSPSGNRDQIRLGVLTCSDYRQGFFTALHNLSARNDLDAILHLGDYIYEGGGGPPEREHDPDFEIYRLQDYRTRLSQYRLDSNLQRCHQVYPWINIWDDHDIVVDALTDTSYRHNAAAYGPYQTRKQAAVQAFREWLPVRDPDSLQQDFYKNWRHLPFGDLLDLYMLDVRLYDRDRFAVDQNDTLFGHPDAKILGPDQLNWINSELQNSTARWKVLGNQLQMTQFQIGNVPLVFENWDGYPVERTKFFDNIINNSIDNMVVLTGDFHVSFANDVTPNPFNILDYNPLTGAGAIGVEFIVPSVTGDNFDEGNDFGLGSAALASGLIQAGNWHTKFVELEGHGYVLLDLDSVRAQAEFWHMGDIDDPSNFNENLVATWVANDGENHLSQGSGASNPNTNVAPAPPCPGIVFQPEPYAPATVLSLFPNPTDRYVYLNYILQQAGMTQINLLDLQGRRLREVLEKQQAPGNFLLEIDTDDLDAGVYLVEIINGDRRVCKKVIRR